LYSLIDRFFAIDRIKKKRKNEKVMRGFLRALQFARFFFHFYLPILYNRPLPAFKASTETIVAARGTARAEKGSR